MNPNPIVDKIRKLLALANSSNEHEAALAAAHAQRLLSEHNLAMADIGTEQLPPSAEKVETVAAKSLPKWIRQLSAGVCTAFDCQAIHHPALGRMTFIGVGADVQIAAYAFGYLEHALRRLCSNYMQQHAGSRIAARDREMLRQSYYLGAVSAVNRQLQEQRARTPVTPGALVQVKEGLISKAMEELGPIRTVRGRRSFVSAHAYSQGESDGRNVHLRKGVAGGRGHGELPE